MARKRANLTDLLNDLTARSIYDKYRLIAMNAFKWEGLPAGILPRHIETALFEKGKAAFFKAPGMSFMCLEASNGGQIDVYGDPLAYHVHGVNYQKHISRDDCVIIENNLLRIPTKDFIMLYTRKLTEAERTMDVNVKANKTPIVFACDDKTLLSFKQLFHEVDGNAPAVWADTRLNLDAITTFDTKVKFLCNDLMDYKRSVECELLTFLGVNNSPIDKKERVITSEADSNNQLIESFADLQLEARERAVEAINKKYGLSIRVSRRQTVENSVETVSNGEGE